MGWDNILLDSLLATFERAIRALRSIKKFVNRFIIFDRRSILVRLSDGRNLKMRNPGLEANYDAKMIQNQCKMCTFSFLRIAASENLTKIDLETRIFNEISKFLMLCEEEPLLSN